MPFTSGSRVGPADTKKSLSGVYGTPAKNFSSVAEWEAYAQLPSSQKTAIGTKPYKGGYLTGAEFNQAIEAEKSGLTADFEAKQAEAKAANEERYADILAQYGTTIEGATTRGPETLQFDETQFAGLGDQAKKDIAQTYKNLEASGTQSLVSAGLAGTTARGALQSRVAKGKAAETASLNEQLRREQIGYGTEIDRFNVSTRNAYNQYLDSLTAQKLSFMERREDIGPDQALFLQQLEKFGNV